LHCGREAAQYFIVGWSLRRFYQPRRSDPVDSWQDLPRRQDLPKLEVLANPEGLSHKNTNQSEKTKTTKICPDPTLKGVLAISAFSPFRVGAKRRKLLKRLLGENPDDRGRYKIR